MVRIDLYVFLYYSINKRSFRVPGGGGGGFGPGPKSVLGNWPPLPPGGLLWPPVDDGTDAIYSYGPCTGRVTIAQMGSKK